MEPRVDYLYARGSKVRDVPRDYDHSVNHRRGSDECVAIRALIRDVEACAASRDCRIDGQDATSKR